MGRWPKPTPIHRLINAAWDVFERGDEDLKEKLEDAIWESFLTMNSRVLERERGKHRPGPKKHDRQNVIQVNFKK